MAPLARTLLLQLTALHPTPTRHNLLALFLLTTLLLPLFHQSHPNVLLRVTRTGGQQQGGGDMVDEMLTLSPLLSAVQL
jgi:hypothetical protein